MKELIQGIIWLVASLIVFTLLIIVGTIYNLFYSVYLSFTVKWYMFFVFWLKTIDGWLASIGYALMQIGVSYDMLGNVNGEVLEDLTTPKEQTLFGKKLITVSTSLGEIETKGWKYYGFGQKLSSILNWFFNEKSHTKYAYEAYLLKRKHEENKKPQRLPLIKRK